MEKSTQTNCNFRLVPIHVVVHAKLIMYNDKENGSFIIIKEKPTVDTNLVKFEPDT
jgi:hypothetical protein